MPRTEVYQLRLTRGEKDMLGHMAREQGVSIAAVIRHALGLSVRDGRTIRKDEITPEEARRRAKIAEDIETLRQSLPPDPGADKSYTRLVKQLQAQGYDLEDAQARARKRLGM